MQFTGEGEVSLQDKETRTLKISAETVTANTIGDLGGAIEDMPRYASTVGMKEILSAKKIVLRNSMGEI